MFRSGPNQGIKVTLNLKSYDIPLFVSGDSTGARIVIFTPGEIPLILFDGIDISPNMYTTALIQRNIAKILKAPYKSNCFDSWSSAPFVEEI